MSGDTQHTFSNSTAPTENKGALYLLFGGGYITIAAVFLNYLFHVTDFSSVRTWIVPAALIVLFGINLFFYYRFFTVFPVKLIIVIVQIVIASSAVYLGGWNENITIIFFIVIPMIVLAFKPVLSVILGFASLLSLFIVYWLLVDFGSAALSILPMAGGFLFFGVVAWALIQQQKDRQRAEDLFLELEEAHNRLRKYSLQVEELAVEKERNRLARDIHDNLGHYLTAMTMQLQAAGTLIEQDPTKASEVIAKAEDMARDSLSAVRESVSSLRTSPADSLSITEAAESLMAGITRDGIHGDVIVRGDEFHVPVAVKTAIFRVIQEGLTNIRKHAKAGAASVILEFGDGGITLEIRDNGIGSRGTEESGYGLMGLTERIIQLNGRLTAENCPGGGFRLNVSIPCSLDPEKQEPGSKQRQEKE